MSSNALRIINGYIAQLFNEFEHNIILKMNTTHLLNSKCDREKMKLAGSAIVIEMAMLECQQMVMLNFLITTNHYAVRYFDVQNGCGNVVANKLPYLPNNCTCSYKCTQFFGAISNLYQPAQ